jgi:hypothetical protein
MISRRHFLERSAALATFLARERANGQNSASPRPGSKTELSTRVIREFPNSSVRALSPDGKKLCMFYSKHPTRSFREQGSWSETTPELHVGDDALKILEFGSWNEIYSWGPREKIGSASFFSDSEALYAETEPILGRGQVSVQRLLISLRTGRKEEGITPFGSAGFFFTYSAIDQRILLGTGVDEKTSKIESLVRVDTPSYEELQRVPADGSGVFKRQCDVIVASDRKTFVHSIDNMLLCRNSGDLRVKWTRQMQRGLFVSRIAASANGGLVATTVGDTSPSGGEMKFTEIYNGSDGSTVARLSAFSHDGLAISPDGRLLAIGEMVPIQGKRFGRTISGTQPTVLLIEISSGKKVATLIHDSFIGGGKEFIYSGFGYQSGIVFTPDSKYLVTSGRNAKVWQLG